MMMTMMTYSYPRNFDFFNVFMEFDWYFAYSVWTVLIFQKGKSSIKEWHHNIIITLQLSRLSEKAFVVETKLTKAKKEESVLCGQLVYPDPAHIS